jgi:hypothetical protein
MTNDLETISKKRKVEEKEHISCDDDKDTIRITFEFSRECLPARFKDYKSGHFSLKEDQKIHGDEVMLTWRVLQDAFADYFGRKSPS